MELINSEIWEKGLKNNTDPYGSRIYSYAKDWAELMEKALAEGKKLEEVADSTSHTADYDGITGFMYGCAVNILASVWKHGEQLRIWHNLKTQIGTEGVEANKKGTVLNPALLNISK